MDARILELITALRAEGVRISLAESQDAMSATDQIGVQRRAHFKAALKASLVKTRAEGPIFERYFDLFFAPQTAPMLPAGAALDPAQLALLKKVLEGLLAELGELLRRMLAGRPLSESGLDQAIQGAGLDLARGREDAGWLTNRALRKLGFKDLVDQIEALLEALAEQGMPAETVQALGALLEGNRKALEDQIRQGVGHRLAERVMNRKADPVSEADLLDRPFHALKDEEIRALRGEVSRLAARLRTRAALRQRRGKGPAFDAKATLRANVRYGGVPFEIVHKRRRRKAKFSLICDVSTSMRPVVSFLLLLLTQIQDLVGRTRSFAFIDRMEEITPLLAGGSPEQAIEQVLESIRPGHYNTDLGASLAQFVRQNLDAVDRRTTIILCGDARNNHNDPRLDLVELLRRRSRKLVWFNPESPRLWGTGDSDMPAYRPHADAVFQVSNLRQLSQAVDQLIL